MTYMTGLKAPLTEHTFCHAVLFLISYFQIIFLTSGAEIHEKHQYSVARVVTDSFLMTYMTGLKAPLTEHIICHAVLLW